MINIKELTQIHNLSQKHVSQSGEFFTSLNSLRGIAALLIVMFHVGWMNPLFEYNIVRNGHMAVAFFFVLSGFVICHNYLGRIVDAKDLVRFMSTRFARLYPLFFVMLMVFLVLELAKYFVEIKFGVVANYRAFSINNGYTFIKELFLFHSVVPTSARAFNVPDWTVSALFYAYLIFAALQLIVNSKKHFIWAAVLICLFAAVNVFIVLHFEVMGLTNVINLRFFRCLAGFFAGTLGYIGYKKITEYPAQLCKYSNLIAALPLLLLFIVACLLLLEPCRHEELISLPVFVALVFSFALTCGIKNIVNSILSHSIFRWLGKVSFSIYLVHFFVVYIYAQVLRLVLKVPTINYEGFPALLTPSPIIGFLFFCLSLITVLILSYCAYRYIEEPIYRCWKSRLNSLIKPSVNTKV